MQSFSLTMLTLLALVGLGLACFSKHSIASRCDEDNIDYHGDDMPNGKRDSKSFLHCRELCQHTSGCKYWTWVGEGEGRCSAKSFKCYMKTGKSGARRRSNVVSGPKDCNRNEKELPTSNLLSCMQLDTDYTEKEFTGAFWVESEIHCLDACKATPECNYWTYTTEEFRGWPMKCHLKRGKGEEIRKDNVVSGPRNCVNGQPKP